MTDKPIWITKLMFDHYWIGANLDRIGGLMTHELEAILEHHWSLLVAEGKRTLEVKKGG